jgi:PAS domain S-box-containing protein
MESILGQSRHYDRATQPAAARRGAPPPASHDGQRRPLSDPLSGFITLNSRLKITYVNSALLTELGRTSDEVLGRFLFAIFPSLADTDGAAHLREAMMAGGPTRFQFHTELTGREYEVSVIPTATGANVHFHARLSTADREEALYTAYEAEKSARSEAETRLLHARESEELFRSTFEQAAVGIAHVTLDGRWVRVNRKLCDIVGYSSDALISGRIQELTFPDDRETESAYRRRLANGEIDKYTLQQRFVRRDGSPVWVNLTASIARTHGGTAPYAIAVIQDIDERMQLEEQLRQSQRLESVGKLAGGIAHEFNNMLTAIVGYADLASLDLPAGSACHIHLNNIRRSAERSASLTRQLLAFARKQLFAPQVIDLNELVRDLEPVLRRITGETVDVITSLLPGLGDVRADRGQIEQVLINLVLNARDAMPAGGRLLIETRTVTFESDHMPAEPDLNAGEYVLLAITDTGSGMTAAVRQKVFEPFFTTKEVGKGTGLGLSTCYGIVKQSGGQIRVYSEPGRGTTFKIYLPQIDAPEQCAPQSHAAAPLPGGSETILVAEDEPHVRAIVERTLQELGYRVLSAADGVEALALAAAHAGQIDLVFSDVVMPRVGGAELAEQLQASGERFRLLFTSGYTQTALAINGPDGPHADFIQKPFTAAALARKVREALDRA